MFGGWRERFNRTTQDKYITEMIYFMKERQMGFIMSTKINFKIILSGYSEPEAEWTRSFRGSDWKVWFVANGNGCIVKCSAFPPQLLICILFHQCRTHASFYIQMHHPYWYMQTLLDVMLCVGGWCFDYLQICAGYPSVANSKELSANSTMDNQGETPHVPSMTPASLRGIFYRQS